MIGFSQKHLWIHGNKRMKKNILYSQEIQIIIKIISLIAMIILVISNTRRIESYGVRQLLINSYEFVTFVINFISILLFFLLILYPMKIEIFSVGSFLYGIQILLFEPQNNIGILMYGLSIITLYARGMFNKHRRIKNVIASILFVAFILSELRFGKELFFRCVLEKMAYIFLLFLCLFFFQVYTLDVFETNDSNNKLDIQKFPELKKRDAEWLVEILNGEKYEALAINYHMSLGSVKNRLKIIFDEIGVGDKQGFLNKYSDYEISYGDNFSSIKNKKKKKFFNI